MKPISQLIKIGSALVVLLFLSQSGQPCGPSFPNSILEQGRKAWLLAPEAAFVAELESQHLLPRQTAEEEPSKDQAEKTVEADLGDLEEFLAKAKTPEAAAVFRNYKQARAKVSHLKDQSGEDSTPDEGQTPSPTDLALKLFSDLDELSGMGVPAEFIIYLKGAVQWRIGETNAASKFWNELLELPATERHYRSTWAAHMLGKILIKSEPALAHERFDSVRRLAAVGFADSLHLAEESFGWEALVYLNEMNYSKALEWYLKQRGSLASVLSLRIVAAKALDHADASELQKLAANDTCRKVITAFLISGGLREEPFSEANQEQESEDQSKDQRKERLPKWLAAVEGAGVAHEQLAERLALAAYQQGDMEAAQRWIRAAPSSITAHWLQAKLHFYNGQVEEAAQVLRQVSLKFPTAHDSLPNDLVSSLGTHVSFGDTRTSAPREMLAELGAIELNRENFVQALDAFAKANYWQDAAFVAERVLKIEELKDYVDANCPVPEDVDSLDDRGDLRGLLARRLMRLNRMAEARPYFSPACQAILDQLVDGLTTGYNQSESPAKRAGSLFQAATITRKHGMELLGTELEPDWAIHRGAYDFGFTGKDRINTEADSLPPLEAEIQRIKASDLSFSERFHYRYIAAEIGWLAAALMPNNADETARVLCESGSWIKYRNPLRADKFYKALVRRCRATEIGARADAMRWFPVLDENGKIKQKSQAEPSEPSAAPEQ